MLNIRSIFTIPELRGKYFYTIIALGLVRIGSHIPISGVDMDKIQNLFNSGGILGFFNLFSGGALSRFSIFALGILPYINASIIMQLLTITSTYLKELSDEGESGRKQIAQYTRYLAVVLSVVQAVVMTTGFSAYISPDLSRTAFFIYSVVSLVAGATLVMWIGELITERGIGNGASLLIFIGIISSMPSYVQSTVVLLKGGTNIMNLLLFLIIILGMIVSIVYVQEAERKVPVQYAKKVIGKQSQTRHSTTYIPLRLIQGGVMPIIFASAIIQFPLMIAQYINSEKVQVILNSYFQYDDLFYNLLFCGLIFFFTYFYTAITFNPEEISNNIKRYGGFILGIRPGKSTEEYLDKILSKITFLGALFLSVVALIPIGAAQLTQITSFVGLGGTAILIIVGVAMDLVKQTESYIINKQYDGLIN
tara:strand:- start:366 stop:1631 length:1266 start_codon:yes stop_codon:yes gene_type:complete